MVATDDAIVLYRTTDEAGAAPDWLFDPAEQSWSELPDDPLGPAFGRSMVWNGEALFLFDKALVESPGGADGPSYTRAARYEDGAWTAPADCRHDRPGPRAGRPASADRAGPRLRRRRPDQRLRPMHSPWCRVRHDRHEWGDLPNAPGKGRKDISSYGGVSATDLVAGSTRGQFFVPPPTSGSTSHRSTPRPTRVQATSRIRRSRRAGPLQSVTRSWSSAATSSDPTAAPCSPTRTCGHPDAHEPDNQSFSQQRLRSLKLVCAVF